jgi:hypothetical protein
MKIIFTLLFTLFSICTFAQIGDNQGATRDDHTTSIHELDIQSQIKTIVFGSKLSVNSLNQAIKINSVKVYDINGQMIHASQLNRSSWEMDMVGYAAGIYIVAIEANQKQFATKVFVSGF